VSVVSKVEKLFDDVREKHVGFKQTEVPSCGRVDTQRIELLADGETSEGVPEF
jgi:hypothetical protein